MSIELKFVEARTPGEIGPALSAVSRARAEALYILESAVFYTHRVTLTKLALNARIPVIYGTRRFAEEGGLISYGVDYAERMRRSAVYVDKILKGAKPSDLPIEQPSKFELVVNLKTARLSEKRLPPAHGRTRFRQACSGRLIQD